MNIAILGLGEAGSRFANDLVELEQFMVSGWDPDPQQQLDKRVHFAAGNADAVANADVVFSVNSAEACQSVATEVANSLKPDALYCEMNTASPATKREVEAILSDSGAHVLDVAIMAPVPPKGIRSPMLVSGKQALAFQQRLSGVTPVEILNDSVGDAAQRKLLRSIVYKGIAAVVCEAMEAARYHDLEDYMRQQIGTIIDGDEWVDRFIEGSRTHAVRRGHEMLAVADMLAEDGLASSITEATIENLARYVEDAE